MASQPDPRALHDAENRDFSEYLHTLTDDYQPGTPASDRCQS